MRKKYCGVYLIKNCITRRVRVGSATDIYRRFSNYKAKLRGGTANKYMQQDYNDFGEQKFEFIILEECDPKDLYKREKYYLDFYSDCAMYNKNAIRNINKKIRTGLKAEKYKEKRSEITCGENNGHNTKLSKKDVFQILDMLKQGINRETIASKFDIYPGYISRFGKDRWVKAYQEWKEKEIISIVNINISSMDINISL
jgi:group I intron endonuclease